MRPIPPPRPWEIVELTDLELLAIKSVSAGVANGGQQKLAIATIVKKLAGIYDMSFRPGGQDGERATAFAEGRRFVGTRIMEAVERPMRQSEQVEVADAIASDRRNPKPPRAAKPAKPSTGLGAA